MAGLPLFQKLPVRFQLLQSVVQELELASFQKAPPAVLTRGAGRDPSASPAFGEGRITEGPTLRGDNTKA